MRNLGKPQTLVRVLVLIVALTAIGCSRSVENFSPKSVLEKYIQLSFNVRSLDDRQKLVEFLSGDTKTRLIAWSDEQFLKAFVESTRQFRRLRILETKKTSEAETLITYELSFDERNKSGPSRVVQKKLCVVVKEGSDWKIREVKSIRESIEYTDGLSLP